MRLLVSVMIAFGALIGGATLPVASAEPAEPPTLTGEGLGTVTLEPEAGGVAPFCVGLGSVPTICIGTITGTFEIEAAQCNEDLSGTMQYRATGIAEGPYPGTYVETGTLRLSSEPVGDPILQLKRAVEFSATFSIDSPVGQVTGQKSLVAGPLLDYGRCNDIGGDRSHVDYMIRNVTYEATIETDSGSFRDEGQAAVRGSMGQWFGGSAAQGWHAEGFVSRLLAVERLGPAVVVLDPLTAINPVASQHCVTATATDASGNPTEDVTVYFTVTGTTTERDTSSGSAVTNSDGQAEFCYTAQFPGSDTITAVADADSDGSPELGEPTGTASKTYVLPVSTALCQVTISDGGWIIAANGDRASFGGVAKVKDGQTRGEQVYQDHGPAQPFTVKSTSVLAVVCGGSEATIYGRATVDGGGQYFFRIQVSDLSNNGKSDRYGILLSNGYSSGDRVLRGGNIVIKRS